MKRAAEIFNQNNGEVTKAYYAELQAKGFMGEMAVALFRAQKRSTAAKRYRRGRFRRSSYDVKNWSLSEICRLLSTLEIECEECQGTGNFYRNDEDGDFLDCDHCDHGMVGNQITWGWQRDPATPGYEWVLYVDLFCGQVSFHSAERLSGPDYPREWDRQRLSEARILAFCDAVADNAVGAPPTIPYNATPVPEPATQDDLFGGVTP